MRSAKKRQKIVSEENEIIKWHKNCDRRDRNFQWITKDYRSLSLICVSFIVQLRQVLIDLFIYFFFFFYVEMYYFVDRSECMLINANLWWRLAGRGIFLIRLSLFERRNELIGEEEIFIRHSSFPAPISPHSTGLYERITCHWIIAKSNIGIRRSEIEAKNNERMKCSWKLRDKT